MSLHTSENTTGRVTSRRNVVRGAAWSTAAVTIVIATPNIAAASTMCQFAGTRNGNGNGSAFTVTIVCATGTITSVTIGGTTATPEGGGRYVATLTDSAPAQQTVTANFASGATITETVTFS